LLAPAEAAQLVQRIEAGDAAAEEELIAAFQDAVRALARARVRDRESARDVSQQVFLSVLTALRAGRLREGERLAGYVAATARNVALRFVRDRPDQREQPLEREPAAAASCELEERERLELVRDGIARLDHGERAVLELTFREGLEPRQIAERLALGDEVVRARKSRGLKRLLAYVQMRSRARPARHFTGEGAPR
jgi:RNA polymerase sigma-70 factor (ECF subfamily)